jgi:uncharacterized protein YbaR (Trm112 family)
MKLAFEQCLELLCCPRCKGDLQRPGDDTLHCASCEYSFPIIDGIPVLLPTNVAAEQRGLFKRYWDSEERAAVYNQKVEGEGEKDAFGVYNHEAEIFGLVALYRDENIDVVLDAGCGNGRFLETFPETSLRIGIDASLNLLRWATQRNPCLLRIGASSLPRRRLRHSNQLSRIAASEAAEGGRAGDVPGCA